jgi:hypothetical protein
MLSDGGYFFAPRLGVKYTKPPLTIDQQVDLLISRGMLGDRDLMKSRLGSVNYYRLSSSFAVFASASSSVLVVLCRDGEDVLDELDHFLTSWALGGPRRNRFAEAATAQRG